MAGIEAISSPVADVAAGHQSAAGIGVSEWFEAIGEIANDNRVS